MSPLYLGILVVVTVMVLVAQKIPKTKSDLVNRGLVGVSTVVFASLLFVLFEQSSPLNLLLLTDKAQLFEVVLISVGYAFLVSACLGVIRLLFSSR